MAEREYLPEPVPFDLAELPAYLERELNRISDAVLSAAEPDFGGMRLSAPLIGVPINATPQRIPYDTATISRGVVFDATDNTLRLSRPGPAQLSFTAIFNVQQSTILRVEAYVGGVPTGQFIEIEIIQQQDREEIALQTLVNASGETVSFFITANPPRAVDILSSTAYLVRL